jgi:hypothetical protein
MSVFGYITVLPGAFSAYRYIALQNGEGSLKYSLGEKMHGAGTNFFTSNMYLAEDQVSVEQKYPTLFLTSLVLPCTGEYFSIWHVQPGEGTPFLLMPTTPAHTTPQSEFYRPLRVPMASPAVRSVV